MGVFLNAQTMLYFIPTPIGNLEDMTYRAVRTLEEVDFIYAEDTRTSKKLMQHFNISTPLRSFHAFNEHKEIENIIGLLDSGVNIALISDAGTPGISDPGFLLARACREANILVTTFPGATALIPALVSSGLPCDKFHFEGFLPHKKGRKKRLEYIASLPETVVLYESPHRLGKCIEELEAICGSDRKATVCREISKLHEEIKHGSLAELKTHFPKGKKVKGEIVVVLDRDNSLTTSK